MPRLFFAVLLLIVVLAVALSRERGRGTWPPEASSVTSVVFSYARHGADQREIIDDREVIAQIVEHLPREEQEPCKCLHDSKITLNLTSGSTLRAEICDHCFDLADGNGTKHYAMTEGLYALFRARADAWSVDGVMETPARTK